MNNLEPAILEFIEATQHLKDVMDSTYLYFRENGLSGMRATLLLRTQFFEIVGLKSGLSTAVKNAAHVVWGFWSPPYFKKKPTRLQATDSAISTYAIREK